jgi:hypothetical protein
VLGALYGTANIIVPVAALGLVIPVVYSLLEFHVPDDVWIPNPCPAAFMLKV